MADKSFALNNYCSASELYALHSKSLLKDVKLTIKIQTIHGGSREIELSYQDELLSDFVTRFERDHLEMLYSANENKTQPLNRKG